MLERIKFFRIPHLPWSEKISGDDKVIKKLDKLTEFPVVVTFFTIDTPHWDKGPLIKNKLIKK